ncbi:Pex12 amino terminal region-domain-containing protein [Lipomyces japonicus]|uniref:Pex12 amino terminal region-domain-containing protein n=1 Tax=Lipomyces japonicus TaxID=56871 RepID=UPI0034CF1A2E
MSIKMSHLLAINPLLLDPSRPTLFELVTAEQLSALLAPSVRYVLAHAAQRHPRYLLRAVLNFDELYALLAAAIELRCLKTWNASLTESFYDLKRCRFLPADRIVIAAAGGSKQVEDRVNDLGKLGQKEIYGSLLALVGIPYLQEKLDRYYESIQARSLFRTRQAQQGISNSSSRIDRIKAAVEILFKKFYPSIKFGGGTLAVLFNLLYLFGKSPHRSFIDFLLNIRFTRQTDLTFASTNMPVNLTTTQITSSALRQRLSQAALTAFDWTLSSILPTAVLSLKILEWWHASDFSRQLSISNRRRQLEVQSHDPMNESDVKYALAPPIMPSSTSSDDDGDGDGGNTSNICQLCQSEIRDPTAIETGKVFCYSCIYSYISQTRETVTAVRCPSTGRRLLACRIDDITGKWIAGGLRRLII